MINVQAAGYCEELIKLAKRDQETQKVVETQAGMPFPEKPGPVYMRRFFGDALAAALGASAGLGATQLGLQALKRRPGGVRLHEKLRGPLRALGPIVAGGTSIALSNVANEMRKQRLAQAIMEDARKKESK